MKFVYSTFTVNNNTIYKKNYLDIPIITNKFEASWMDELFNNNKNSDLDVLSDDSCIYIATTNFKT